MNQRSRIPIALALLATAAFPSAQAPVKSPAPAPAGHPPAAVPAAKPDSNQILLYVTGLTRENEAQVKAALGGLGIQRYVCDTCKHEQATPGTCPKCKTSLRSEKLHSLANLAVQPDSSSIAFNLAPTSMASLSEIENALTRTAVRIDIGRLALPGRATLVLREGAADSAPAVEKALKTAKLFDDVHVRFDATRHELDVDVRAGATAPKRSAVAKAIEDSGTKARLYDVIWGQAAHTT